MFIDREQKIVWKINELLFQCHLPRARWQRTMNDRTTKWRVYWIKSYNNDSKKLMMKNPNEKLRKIFQFNNFEPNEETIYVFTGVYDIYKNDGDHHQWHRNRHRCLKCLYLYYGCCYLNWMLLWLGWMVTIRLLPLSILLLLLSIAKPIEKNEWLHFYCFMRIYTI